MSDHRASAGLPDGDAADRRCSSSTPQNARSPDRLRRSCSMSDGPRTAWPIGRSTRRSGWRSPHESAELHVTGTALYTDDLVGRTRDVLHAWPVQAPHAHALITGCDVKPAYDVPGVVRVLTAADVPGVNDAGIKHDEPLFPDRGDVLRSRRLLGARARPWTRPGTGAEAIEVDYEPLPSLITARPRRSRRRASRAHQRTVSRGDAEAGLAAAAHRFTRRVRVRRPGALLPGDQRLAGPGGRERPDLRPVQHPAPVGDPGDRRPRARPATPRRDRAVPADGRRVRRQGDAAARLRRDRRPGRDPHRPPGAAAAEPHPGHHHDRQAAPVPRQLGGRLRRRRADLARCGPP